MTTFETPMTTRMSTIRHTLDARLRKCCTPRTVAPPIRGDLTVASQ
jgi:hypothetical protein